MKNFKFIIVAIFALNVFHSWAQTKTISENKNEREVASKNKVMIIPFEKRLYLSEIDHHINAETKLTAKEIRYKFRDGLNEQLYKAFKSAGFGVIDLMEDTVKYKKEIESIYQHLNYEYQKVPDQNNYHPPKKEKEQKKIEKGQLNVESNNEARFMNAKIDDAKLVPMLYAKHKTNVFVYINQLEIRASNSAGPAELLTGTGNRKIVVHYTVYTHDAKEINSGIAEEEFESTLNNPKKIIDKYFAKLAQLIVQRTNKALGVK